LGQQHFRDLRVHHRKDLREDLETLRKGLREILEILHRERKDLRVEKVLEVELVLQVPPLLVNLAIRDLLEQRELRELRVMRSQDLRVELVIQDLRP
jgi:hypothetical protein